MVKVHISDYFQKTIFYQDESKKEQGNRYMEKVQGYQEDESRLGKDQKDRDTVQYGQIIPGGKQKKQTDRKEKDQTGPERTAERDNVLHTGPLYGWRRWVFQLEQHEEGEDEEVIFG